MYTQSYYNYYNMVPVKGTGNLCGYDDVFPILMYLDVPIDNAYLWLLARIRTCNAMYNIMYRYPQRVST